MCFSPKSQLNQMITCLSHERVRSAPLRSTGVRSLGLVLALALAACGTPPEGDPLPETFPNKPGGNPLVPEVAGFPFPSDFYLAKDEKTATGYHVAIPDAALPTGPGLTAAQFRPFDGFSRIPAILAFLPGGVDGDSLPDPRKPELTVKADSPVMLLEGTSWKQVPILAENDARADTPRVRALIIRPLRALRPSTRYVVVLRDTLRTADGKPHEANDAFRALRDGLSTNDPAIERQRKDFVVVREAIEKAGLERSEVVLAWSFHTRSEKQVVAPLLAMHDIVERYQLGDATITSDEIDAKKNRQLAGHFMVPNFVPGAGRGIELSSAGKPIQFGKRKVEFVITVPDSVKQPRPVVVWGHGFLGSRIQATRGSVNELCRKSRFVTAGTNIGFNDDIETETLKALTTDLSSIDWVVAENLQTFVNHTALARLLKEKLSKTLTKTTSTGRVKVIDPDEVHYAGASNGGTFGLVVAATSPEFERAALVVGGGGLTHFLQRAVQWNGYGPVFDLVLKEPREQQLAFSLLQTSIDPIDSMSYASHLVNDRFKGLKPMRAAMHMAVNDSQVRNLVTEWVARTAGVKLVVPTPKKVYGLDTIHAEAPDGAKDVDGVMFVYDEKVAPSPVTNLPPKKDNGTHGTVRELDVYMKSVTALIEHGKFVQYCDGACDPH